MSAFTGEFSTTDDTSHKEFPGDSVFTLAEEASLHKQEFELQDLIQLGESRDGEDNLATSKRTGKRESGLFVATENTAENSLSLPPEFLHNSHEAPMGRNSVKSNVNNTLQTSSVGSGSQNGAAQGKMNEDIEMRRKLPPRSSTQASDFSLDNAPVTPETPISNTSFFELPRQDRRNFMLLVLLYFLQGVPMGLAMGSVPFLLKSHLSYGQIGIFTLASYPYSLKLLWSPIVDAVWSPAIGRRKSWILPIQLCSGFGMLYMGGRAEKMMIAAGATDGSGVWTFTWWWFFLVFLCATQDIAVDGNLLLCCYEQTQLYDTAKLTFFRLGFDSDLDPKSFLCIYSSDCRSNSRLVSLIHGLSCLQFA